MVQLPSLADVAQLVERRVVVPNVVGSIPIVRPKSYIDLLFGDLLFFIGLQKLYRFLSFGEGVNHGIFQCVQQLQKLILVCE